MKCPEKGTPEIMGDKEMEFKNDKMKNLFAFALERSKEFSFWGRRIMSFYSDSVVLDHGCGTGAELAQIAPKHRGFLVGNDTNLDRLIVAKRLIRKCCKTCRNVDFVLADSTHLPFIEGHFDFVLSSFVLEHVRKRDIALEEAYRVVEGGGCVIISLDTYLRCIGRCLKGYRSYLMFIVSRERRKGFVERLRLRIPKKNEIAIEHGSNRLEPLFKRLKRVLCILSYLVFPIRHGDYEHSAQEFVAHLPSSWVNMIKRSSFEKFEIAFPSAKQRVGRYPGEMMIKAYKMRARNTLRCRVKPHET